MGNCKIHFQDGVVRDCDYLRQNLDRLKVEFRENNRTDEILKRGRIDRAYEAYSDELESVLANCKCSKKLKTPVLDDSCQSWCSMNQQV